MTFIYDPDLEAVAHLTADAIELEARIRGAYLPAVRRLWARSWPGADSLSAQLGLTLDGGRRRHGGLVVLTRYGRRVLEQR